MEEILGDRLKNSEPLEDIVLAAEIRAIKIIGIRDVFDLSEFSEDIHYLISDNAYMRSIRKLISGFIKKEEDLPTTFGTVTQDELNRFIEFTTVISHRMHLGQARKSRKPYFIHPLRLNQILAETLGSRKISYISTAVNNLHDIYEKQDIDFPARDSSTQYMGEGLQVPLEMYNFVKNDRRIRQKPYFFRGINSIFWITVGLTKPKDKSYISYLYSIFYPREGHAADLFHSLKQISRDSANGDISSFDDKILNISRNLGRIHRVRDIDEFVMNYIADVDLEYNWTHSNAYLMKKHTRRSIIPKLCDFISNEEDLRDPAKGGDYSYIYPLNVRAYRYFKGFVMAHATFEKYSRQAFREKEEYGKIMPLAKRLLDTIIGHSAEDLKIIRGFLGPEFIETVHHELEAYKRSSHYHKLTTTEDDRSRFAGTFIRYLRMLEFKDERNRIQGDYEQMYADMLALNSKFNDFKANFHIHDSMLEEPEAGRNENLDLIGGFSLLNMKNITDKFSSNYKTKTDR